MPGDPPTPPLRDRLYEKLRSGIANGDFPEGQRLPTEVELARRFGVSRPIVREALARLRYEGVVASRRGSGSVVVRRPAPPSARTDQVKSIADLRRCFEFRVALEGEIAALAAARATEDDVRTIATLNDAFVAVRREGKNAIEEDLQFHAAIARSSQNHLFVSAILNIENLVRFTMSFGIMLETIDPEERLRQTLREHRDIVDALRDHSPDRARRAMMNHIDYARRRMFEDDAQVAEPLRSSRDRL